MDIRNFCIISHIDHGKSTLADRFLELTGTVEKRKMREQFLDRMDLERERGITIKLQPVRMEYKVSNPAVIASERSERGNPLENHGIASSLPAVAPRNDKFILNLIDTPGHVDFSYEVSRSLAAVEGAVLLVDASQGVQAQTLANLDLALEQGLTIIPVINKIDLPQARVEETEKEILQILEAAPRGVNLGANLPNYLGDSLPKKISAKNGTNVEQVLEAIIQRIPRPAGQVEAPLRALIFDSQYDTYKGVIAFVRIVDGQVKPGQKILMLASGAQSEVLEVGIFKPELTSAENLKAGEIGYLATGLKDVSLCRVGDTITISRTVPWTASRGQSSKCGLKPLPGYREPKPMVFASFYPAAEADFERLKDGLNKLKLNDASLVFEPESSEALGRGFQCGFLGLLHLEIVNERLKREYDLDLVITAPSVSYKITFRQAQGIMNINSVSQLPEWSQIKEIQEPWLRLEVISPASYIGQVMKVLENLDGLYKDTRYLSPTRVIIEYEAPLREMIVGRSGTEPFYDQLKSATAGYASMAHELIGYRPADLVCLDILVAGEKVRAFSRLVPRQRAAQEGRALVKRLKEIIPAQLFAVAIQAAVGNKIIARETIRALRKDVTGYLYGGDYTRKRKLLEKQKRGKKKMKQLGEVRIPSEVFLRVLKK